MLRWVAGVLGSGSIFSVAPRSCCSGWKLTLSSAHPFQFPDIVEFSETMANAGKTVIVAALDGTFQRKVRHLSGPGLGMRSGRAEKGLVRHRAAHRDGLPSQPFLLPSAVLPG